MPSAEKADSDEISLDTVKAKLAKVTGLDMIENVEGELKVKTYDRRTFEQSICDIIDNSIDGGASTVEIIHRKATFLGEQDYAVMIIDDGSGIKPENMRRSISFSTMKEGGYEPWELGTFGVGLKDASLAQAHEVTLLSKTKGAELQLLRLSSIYVKQKKKWKILDYQALREVGLITKPIEYAEKLLKDRSSGTAVIWEDLHSLKDKIILNDETETDDLIGQHEDKIKEYISMTFANYLEGIKVGPRVKEKPLSIEFNGAELKPLDPFFKSELNKDNQGTLMKPYSFTFNSAETGSSYPVTINRYILPNRGERDLRSPQHDARMCTATNIPINGLQGIYFYRNGRLLDGPWNESSWRIRGTGLGDAHYTCARWEIDLPPSIADEPTLLDPSKTRVQVTRNLENAFLDAKDKKEIWLEPDDMEKYGYVSKKGDAKVEDFNASGEGVRYSVRARSRNDGKDVANYCAEAGCKGTIHSDTIRVLYQGDKCESCTRNYCTNCTTNRVDQPGDICVSCDPRPCSTKGCTNIVCPPVKKCDDCSSPRCTHSSCNKVVLTEGTKCQNCDEQYCHSPNCENESVRLTSYCSSCGMVGDGPKIGFESREEGKPFYRIDAESGDTWINTTHPDFDDLCKKVPRR